MKRLCDFVNTHSDAIAARWVERVQALGAAPSTALLEQMPELIASLAEAMRQPPVGRSGGQACEGPPPRTYALLRQSIFELWEEHEGPAVDVGEAGALASAIDALGANEPAREREQLLAIVCHELRNPLNAITVAGAMLVRRLTELRGEERAQRHAEIVDRSAHRIEALIEQLAQVARIQAGRLTLEPGPHPVPSLLDEVAVRASAQAAARGVALSTAPAMSGPVRADRARLLEVFDNVVGDALAGCQPGDALTLGARQSGGSVVFSVATTGPGLEEQEREHFFELRWPAPKRPRGEWLGLFISRGIVEAHGGAIWVESAEGEGTTVFFSLPATSAGLEPPFSLH
ncbi:MAG: HAMP domain-containing sensor histidine kinase [Myxococcaceae bacterium]